MKTVGKISLFVFILLIVLSGIAFWWVETYGPKRLVAYLQDRVQITTNGRYQLRLDSLELDLIDLSVGMTNLRFERDTLVQALSGNPLLDGNDITVYYNNLSIQYFDLLRFVRTNHLKVNYFQLIDPRIIIRKNPDYRQPVNLPQDSIDIGVDSMEVDSTALQDLVDTTLKVAPVYEIGEFNLVNASFEFYEGRRKEPLLMVKGISSRLFDIVSTADAPIAASNLDFRIDTLQAYVGKYTAKLDAYGFRLSDSLIVLDDVHYRNLIGKYQINKYKGFRANWMDLRVKGLKMEGIDYHKMIADSGLVIRKVHLDQLNLYMFKDKSEPRINPAYKPLPPARIRNIGIPLKIDSIEVAQGEIVVEQHAPGVKVPGALTINRIHALVTNLTNQPEALKEDPYLVVNATARLMDSGPARVAFRFKIDSPEDRFWASGSAGPMPFEAVNPFLSTQTLLRFKSGQLVNLSYDITGNNHNTEGTVDFEYTDLAIAKLEDYQNISDKDPKIGFLLNLVNFVLPEVHLKERKGYKTGQVYAEKPLNRDIVFYWIESLLSGVVSNLGFGPKDPAAAAENQREKEAKKEEREARHQAWLEEQAQKKKEKAEKKEERVKKREEQKNERNNEI